MQVATNPLSCHNTLALMKVNLIHKLDKDNMVLDAPNKQEEFQAMSVTQILWLIFDGEKN